jgi:Acyl-CoA reductase (LuxC)
MTVEMLLPDRRAIELNELRSILAGISAAEPFHDSVVDASIDFSKRIFQDPHARAYPELLALAYWMRKAEIFPLYDQFRALELNNRILTPRGLVFHLPPRNVDTMFVYSWLLSALCGNRNVIRLSPNLSESGLILLRLLRDTLAAAAEPTRNSTIIISYGHEEEPTAMLSTLCDVRVIWGGDQTVATIRRSPLGSHGKEITFPDRYALSVIQANAYASLTEKRRESLADQFFNDSYWFDQMACSSPRLVVWVGSESETRAASADFFFRVAGCVGRRRYVLPAAATMQKLVYTCSAILDSPVKGCRRYKGLTVLTLESLTDFRRSHPGGGLFFEAQIERLADISAALERRDQTLTWFGFSPEELRALARNLNGRAIDRIVPVGQALQFHRFWDGYDLLQEFCRCVYIESAPTQAFSPEQTYDCAFAVSGA